MELSEKAALIFILLSVKLIQVIACKGNTHSCPILLSVELSEKAAFIPVPLLVEPAEKAAVIPVPLSVEPAEKAAVIPVPVSYTHLTLPTIVAV